MRRYALFVIPALGLVAVIVGFLFFNLSDALVYYRTPSEVVDEVQADAAARFRLGGQVDTGSVVDTEAWPRASLMASSPAPPESISLAAVRRRSWGAMSGRPADAVAWRRMR